jgi:GLPGLI family protein
MRYLRLFPAMLVTLFSFSVSAQKTDKPLVTVKYDLRHVIDTTQRDYPLTTQFMLVSGQNMSIYEDYYEIMWEQGTPVTKAIIGLDGKPATTTMLSGGINDGFVMEMATNKMTTLTSAGGTSYAIESSLPEIGWKIATEQKEIAGYKCQKATARFKGRNYTAWFTDQLAYRNGPWKLGGLPGLILEAYDDTGEITFTCVEIVLNPAFKPIRIPPGAIAADLEDVNKIKEALKKNRAAFSGASVTRPGNITAQAIPIGGAPAGRPPRKFANPIEKEDVKK